MVNTFWWVPVKGTQHVVVVTQVKKFQTEKTIEIIEIQPVRLTEVCGKV